ncbi:hypothetical protein [Microbacterium sp. ZXX196]|uniref:hypothetical protein n=1 Tax=Microbacterium sp. ZXX196 TaxID=2609291 RepID=UPI0034D29963
MTDANAPQPGAFSQGEQQPRFVQQMTVDTPLEEPPHNAQQGLGPFTLREWILLSLGLVLFVLSFVSVVQISGFGRGVYAPIWSFGISWVGAVGFPVAAVVLIGLRRFVKGFRNVGALGIDQFASVAFAVSAYVWLNLGITWVQLGAMLGAVVWIASLVALAGIALTVFGRFLPPFREDFAERDEVPAHATARPVRPLLRTPRPQPIPSAWQQHPAPASAEEPGAHATQSSPQAAHPYASPSEQGWPGYTPAAAPAPTDTAASQPVAAVPQATAPREGAEGASAGVPAPEHESATQAVPEQPASAQAVPEAAAPEQTVDEQAAPEQAAAWQDNAATAVFDGPLAAEPAPADQPFWALVPVERDVHDVAGNPSFRIGPTAWALVLEDRGAYFVVRHDDGRIGYLHDTSGVTRG